MQRNLRELKNFIAKNFGKRCKDYSPLCTVCVMWHAFDTIKEGAGFCKSKGAKQYKLEKAMRQYQKGKISIGKAAENAGISLWEIMGKLKERNIVNPLGEEEFKKGLENLEKAWKK